MNDNRKQQYLANDVANLVAHIDALLTEYPELSDDDALKADMLDGETDLHAVLGRLVNIERDADSMAKAIAERARDLASRKARQDKRKEAMRTLMFRLLKAAAVAKVTLPEATVSIGKKAATVEIVDEAALPDNVVRIVRTPDKAAIKEALALGDVPGARMGEVGEQLSVRVA